MLSHAIHIFNYKVKMKDDFAAKDASFAFERTRLKELETKVTRIEEIIDSQKEKEIGSPIGERSVGRSVSFPRTCRELCSSDPTLTSGMHWIDP